MSSKRKVRRAGLIGGLVAAGLVIGGCQSVAGPSLSANSRSDESQNLPAGFTCCNLHHEGDWISDSNYGSLPMIPLGSPARVTGYGRYRVAVSIDGKPMRLGLDYGRAEKLDAFAVKLIVPEDPKKRLATYPPQIQNAITRGQITPGMTKEQVIMSVGYPLTNENPDLSQGVWRYWLSSLDEYQVSWDPTGRVKEVIGAPTALSRILYQP